MAKTKQTVNAQSENQMSISSKKEFAKILYIRERLTNKEVAARVGVGEHTVGRWVQENGWEKLRRSLLVTKQEQIAQLYGQLESLSVLVSTQESKVPDSKQADIYVKLTTAIRNLETEINIGDAIEIGMEFLDYVRQNAPDQVGQVADMFDSYIKKRIGQ